MKIIISHDVDHLYTSDHYFKDLIVEKLLARSVFHWIKGKIPFRVLVARFILLFANKMNNIEEIAAYDREHLIPSTFFFGMRNGLGMSYSKEKTLDFIKFLEKEGFDIGVHGIEYNDEKKIEEEYTAFRNLTGIVSFGVRNHYVRYDDSTFISMDRVGYAFDSTEFNKEKVNLKKHYKVGDMWEFPLHIMDVYACRPGEEETGTKNTLDMIHRAEKEGISYCTILFHDYMFNEKTYPGMKKWYETVVDFCEKNRYEFVSFTQAIEEIEANG